MLNQTPQEQGDYDKMKIAIISDFNIAGQPMALMRAINKYTNHEARCIIANDDYLQYDKDIILSDGEDACKEATEWAKQCDFFHFGRGVFNWPGMDWNEAPGVLRRNNCVIKYYGSELRNNAKQIFDFHKATGVPAITGTDWSIAGLLPGAFYHLGSYFTKYGDVAPCDLPELTHSKEIKICAGSSGSPLKGYEFLVMTIQELKKDGYDIPVEFISGVDNKTCLLRKQQSNTTFTSLHGAWGISGVESMFLGHVVLSCLDSWIMSLYPDTPTVVINKGNLKARLKWLCDMPYDKRLQMQFASRKFAIENFSTKTILKRYLYLFDVIMNGKGYLEGFKNPTEIYDF